MTTRKLKPTSIEEYIDAAPPDVQERLWKLHQCIRKAAPGAAEGLKWNMPAYSYQKILVTFAVFKKHIGFYPMPSAMEAFAKDLAGYSTASGSVQFPLDKPLPLPLIGRMVKFRVKESSEGTIKWRS
ncbi:MAG TPA: DUF1801 domain-containing protein [Ferruginibacter sp.]|nr:hypothetical protein [Chitinophagaceae bacterium]HRI24616.1 DUF1801 domain-containing protein [Ferruginibacter sp.]